MTGAGEADGRNDGLDEGSRPIFPIVAQKRPPSDKMCQVIRHVPPRREGEGS